MSDKDKKERDEALARWTTAMREKLEVHRSKGTWKGETPAALMKKLFAEIEELCCAMSREDAMHEAADVGLFAFMIAENTFPEDHEDGN
jgi:hypothetical protein